MTIPQKELLKIYGLLLSVSNTSLSKAVHCIKVVKIAGQHGRLYDFTICVEDFNADYR